MILNHLKLWSWLLKCLYKSTEGAHDPGELCKYSYDHQAKGESESRGSHLNPNPRTNKANDKKSKRNLKRQISHLLKEKAFNDKDIVTLSMSNRVRTVLDFVFKITLHFLEKNFFCDF